MKNNPIRAHESATATGRLRVYLGMAAGVGKTYAMLDEGHRRASRGCDVVAGFVTTHDRPQTDQQLLGLEVIPVKVVQYHGARFDEMDLAAIVARRPDLALVDELAHTNIPGAGRNEKRWQDVLDLLDANIDVISTVNVQHIESLADVVEQICGIHIPERVPDAVIRQADQIELVDTSPEQLRRRVLHGDIYPPDRVQRALAGFFSTDNLATLRELTLRFLADETEGDLLRLLHRSGPVRQTTERVLVGVTSAPGTDDVLRRAAQIATRLRAELHVVHVTPADALQGADRGPLDDLRVLAEQLDARWSVIRADDPVTAIMELAGQLHITQIVLGPSHRSRWQEFVDGGSTVRRLTRLAGAAGVDIHIIARPGGDVGDVTAEPIRHH